LLRLWFARPNFFYRDWELMARLRNATPAEQPDRLSPLSSGLRRPASRLPGHACPCHVL